MMWLAKNVNKKIDKSTLSISVGNSPGAANAKIPAPSTKVVYPDTSQMVIYDPRQKTGPGFLPNANAPGLPAVSAPILSTANAALGSSGAIKGLDEILKALPPALVTFIAHLPSVEGYFLLPGSNVFGSQLGFVELSKHIMEASARIVFVEQPQKLK
ncbi:hypothetical protein ACLOJK_040582 [Asimina triloba]